MDLSEKSIVFQELAGIKRIKTFVMIIYWEIWILLSVNYCTPIVNQVKQTKYINILQMPPSKQF